jgi:hypothetical protein
MKTHAFIYQSELTSTIDKLLAHFPKYKFKNKINRNDITHFNNFIRDADIFVQNELRFLREFMDLHKDVEMIYLDLFSVESCVLKIYKIWQTVNKWYDTYDSAIVVAESEEEARRISPSGHGNGYSADCFDTIFYTFQPDSLDEEVEYFKKYSCNEWVSNQKYVNVEYLGEAKECSVKGVLLASFNAG